MAEPATMSDASYLVFDGDQIGDLMARAFLANDEQSLRKLDADLRKRMLDAEEFLRGKGFQMIASGADGITCKGSAKLLEETFLGLRGIVQPFTFSLGCGPSLRDAFLCLRYAKASGRNRCASMQNGGDIHLLKKLD